MAINIGINGFGRIGRLVFRSAINNDDFNVVSVNDLLDINHLAYLLKYDSVHGPFDGSVEVSENRLVINGKPVKITAERDPNNINNETFVGACITDGIISADFASMVPKLTNRTSSNEKVSYW